MPGTTNNSPDPDESAHDGDEPSRWPGYAWALSAAAGATLLATPLAGWLELANIVMLYMLALVAIAFRFGKGPAVAAAVMNVAAFDFFFVPPRLSLAVADAQYLLTFAVMLATGLVIAHLAARLRQQAADARLRERRSRDLYEMARRLSGALADEQIIDAAKQFFAHSLGASVALMLRDRAGKLFVPERATVEGIDLALAQRVFEGDSTVDVVVADSLLYVPLKAPMRTRGVLIVSPADVTSIESAGQRRQLETVAVLIAIALERVHFVTVAREATVQMEGERLRSGLLAALSHDLRTPLTAILGSAESLQLGAHGLTQDQYALIDAIRDQARRTHELVENILDMARLESGAVRLRKEWQSLEEIVGSALKARAPVLATHPVIVALPADLPLVECDATLMERVFVNLLENAAKYTPPGCAIQVRARIEADQLRVDVSDCGAGVPHGREAAIFDKFVRAGPTADVPGLGLGLAICRTIIEAHAGRIWVENLPEGGADFAFTLPRGNPPSAELDAPASP
ncbi:MAG: DUF4118 domain-containing protein [Betaproteobacteria bacterium]